MSLLLNMIDVRQYPFLSIIYSRIYLMLLFYYYSRDRFLHLLSHP